MRILRDNALTIVLMLAFLLSIGAMGLTGWSADNQERIAHGQPMLGLLVYLTSGEFASAVFENWESEFLQMAAYVVLTAYLYQRGSAESRNPDNPEDDLSPAPGRWGRIGSFLYSYSLGLALALLFVVSFLFHLMGSLDAANEEALQHGLELRTIGSYLVDPRFWFESFQNWQSEFLSTAVLVVFSIFLRYRGSPESKQVGASNAETGK
jgi:hypothetical protein